MTLSSGKIRTILHGLTIHTIHMQPLLVQELVSQKSRKKKPGRQTNKTRGLKKLKRNTSLTRKSLGF